MGSALDLTQLIEDELVIHELRRMGHNSEIVSKQFYLLLSLGDASGYVTEERIPQRWAKHRTLENHIYQKHGFRQCSFDSDKAFPG
jgi:hypothetical protein